MYSFGKTIIPRSSSHDEDTLFWALTYGKRQLLPPENWPSKQTQQRKQEETSLLPAGDVPEFPLGWETGQASWIFLDFRLDALSGPRCFLLWLSFHEQRFWQKLQFSQGHPPSNRQLPSAPTAWSPAGTPPALQSPPKFLFFPQHLCSSHFSAQNHSKSKMLLPALQDPTSPWILSDF